MDKSTKIWTVVFVVAMVGYVWLLTKDDQGEVPTHYSQKGGQ